MFQKRTQILKNKLFFLRFQMERKKQRNSEGSEAKFKERRWRYLGVKELSTLLTGIT